MRFVLATRNAHKIEELGAIVAGAGLEVVGLDAFPELPVELPETGDTFAANAIEKAAFVSGKTGLVAVADDSGLEVDALGGRPGVWSKRFSDEATDAANNAKLLRLLAECGAGSATGPARTARYRCVIAVAGPNGTVTADGACEGVIGTAGRGTNGFGYDPLFWPVETPGRTMAELSMGEKNAISHRGRATRSLVAMIAKVR